MQAARLLQFPGSVAAKKIEREQSGDILTGSGLADNTIMKYRKASEDFNAWYGSEITERDGKEADLLLSGFAKELHERGKALSTVQIEAAGVKWHFIELFDVSSNWRVWKRTWKGIAREGRERGVGQRDELTWEQVGRLADVAEATGKGIVGIRNAAMLKAMSDGLLRSAELCAVRVEHVERTEKGARMLVPSSKIDQAGKGAYVFLSPETLEALDKWLTVAKIASGHVFISTHGRQSTIGQPISTRTVYNIVRVLACAAGLSGSYGSHSLRIGSAQELAKRGATDAQLMAEGRWTNATMAGHYARPARPEQGAIARPKYGI